MYVNALPLVKDRTEEYFHHGGGAFVETIYFCGLPNVSDFGWNNPGVQRRSCALSVKFASSVAS